LEGYRPKIIWFVGSLLFWEQDNIGFVDGAKVGRKRMKARKGVHEGVFNQQPVFLEESRAEAIRSRTGIVVHGEKSRMDVLHGERADEG
jgi:hypothetical protein